MVKKNFEYGDLVWAKMRGYPYWPSKIEQNKTIKKGYHYIFFFGLNTWAWVLDENIVPHSEERLKSVPKKKSAKLQEGIYDFVRLASMSYGPNGGPKKSSVPIKVELVENKTESSKKTSLTPSSSEKKAGKVAEKVLLPEKEKSSKVLKKTTKRRQSDTEPDSSTSKSRKSCIDYKSCLRSKLSQNKRETEKTGGGEHDPKDLLELERRALPLANLDMVFGLPVPESQQRSGIDNTRYQDHVIQTFLSDVQMPSTSDSQSTSCDLSDMDMSLSELLSNKSQTWGTEICDVSQSSDVPPSSQLSPTTGSKKRVDTTEARLGSLSKAGRRNRAAGGVALNTESCSNLIAAHFAMAEGLNKVAKAIEATTALQQQQFQFMMEMEARKVKCLEQLAEKFIK